MTPTTLLDSPRDVLFNHRAERIAAELWDERDEDGRLRDLAEHEQLFLGEFRIIGNDYTKVCRQANRLFGCDSREALAVERKSKEIRDRDFLAALDHYLDQIG